MLHVAMIPVASWVFKTFHDVFLSGNCNEGIDTVPMSDGKSGSEIECLFQHIRVEELVRSIVLCYLQQMICLKRCRMFHSRNPRPVEVPICMHVGKSIQNIDSECINQHGYEHNMHSMIFLIWNFFLNHTLARHFRQSSMQRTLSYYSSPL